MGKSTRNFGVVLIVIGLIWGIVAFNMTTAVETGSHIIGAVHNLDLADKRRTHLMISGLLIVVGTVLFGFGSSQNSPTVPTKNTRKCPFCAESVNIEAVKCRFCGESLPKVEPISLRVLNIRKDHDASFQECKYTIWQAVSMGDIDLVAQIIESGIDINILDGARQTALDIARRLGHKEIEGLLRQYGGKYSSEIIA